MKVIYKVYENRTAKGMSLRKLAEYSGVSKSTIDDIENQKQNATVLTICMLADALNVEPCELFYYEK